MSSERKRSQAVEEKVVAVGEYSVNVATVGSGPVEDPVRLLPQRAAIENTQVRAPHEPTFAGPRLHFPAMKLFARSPGRDCGRDRISHQSFEHLELTGVRVSETWGDLLHEKLPSAGAQIATPV